MKHVVVLIACVLLASCGYFTDKPDETKTMTAEQLYKAARDRMDSGYYDGAIEYYEKLQARFPFGPFAQQAQLELAYSYYKSEQPASAIAACERFIKLYPTHPNMDYAYFLKGLSNFNQGKGLTQRYLPTDPSQRDPGAALRSFDDFSELIKRFPDSRYVNDAQQRMVYLRNILAQHEVNVAQYYIRRGAYVAAANRARYVVENYQQTPSMPDALLVMARAYRVLQMDDLADDTIRVIELNYPNHPGLLRLKDIRVR
ncbi:MAG: outer membrane protein assembly factor BamD [Gammaproteobacteria bacterium]|nr:outer membrane protein assembly factor BamD [Gammaproteobacteria bacterium]